MFEKQCINLASKPCFILWKFTGRFHKLDHGPAKNMMLYGSHQPPDYNLSNIRTKVHIIYGTNDHLVKSEVCVCANKKYFFLARF